MGYRWLTGMLMVGGLAACSKRDTTELSPSANLKADIDPVTTGSWYQPGVTTTWQLQLTGTLNTSYNVDLYDIDLFDTPTATIASLQASGKKVICYFSTAYEDWRSDADDFLDTSIGNNMDDWPGEKWVDIRSKNVLNIMLARLDLAVEKGCDGVDPDNVNAYQQETGFSLTKSNQIAFNRRIANEAHERGLTVGLKNSGDLATSYVDYFDFELNEQCHFYNECDDLQTFITAGKPVFNAEYELDSTICSTALAENIRTLILPVALDGSSRVSCD